MNDLEVGIQILKLFSKNHDTYLIGGVVKNYILGLDTYNKDIDITTNANLEEIKEALQDYELISENPEYCTVKFNYNDYKIDVTRFRTETYYKKRYPIVDLTDSVEEDAARRDFTINSIYFDKNLNVYDPYNGIKDLNDKIINVIGNVNIRFNEDPIRILRAIRFANYYNFKLSDDIVHFIKGLDKIDKCSKKLIVSEMLNIVDNYNERTLKLVKLINDKFIYDNFVSNLSFLERCELTISSNVFRVHLYQKFKYNHLEYFYNNYISTITEEENKSISALIEIKKKLV